MTKTRWLLAGLGVALVGLAASYVGTLRSYLAGEPFYADKPASYWAREMARWEGYPAVYATGVFERVDINRTSWIRPPTAWEQWAEGYLPALGRRLHADTSIVDGDVKALPVLLVLAEHADPKVRRVAVSGLGLLQRDVAAAAGARKALQDEDAGVREEAETILKVRAGDGPRERVPTGK